MAKICLVNYIAPENFCGISTYANNLLSNLERLDNTNTYYNTFSKQEKHYIEMPGRGLPGPLFYNTLVSGRYLKKYNFDIVHGVGNWIPITFLGSKKIVTIHDVIPLLNNKYPFFEKLFFHNLVPIIAKKADMIISDSEWTKKDVIKYFNIKPEKIDVIPLAASERFNRITDGKKLMFVKQKYRLPNRFVLSVGGSDSRKNLVILLRAFKQAKDRKIIERLVMVGGGVGNNKTVIDEIAKLNLEKDVILIDGSDGDDLPSIYSLATLFVFPSKHEGFGLPPLEAMACGTPVICSNATSLPEVVGDAAILFDPMNVDELAENIFDVLGSDSELKELSKKGLKHAKQFSWQKTAKKTLEVYETVVRK